MGISYVKTILLLILTCCLSTSYAQDYSKLYDEVIPSVVTIYTTELRVVNNKISQSNALGSGVIISSQGMIMTAAHVIDGSSNIRVKLYNGTYLEADILSSNKTADIALIKIRDVPDNLPMAKLGNSAAAKIGHQIIIIGSPMGLEHSLSVGYISGKKSGKQLLNGTRVGLLQTDASVNQGNSGGPMFNMAGEVIGIVSSILSNSGGFEGIGFVVDVNSAQKILLEKNAFWTGFDGFFLDNELAGLFNVPQRQTGVLVQHVIEGSFADKTGLKGGFFEADILGQKLWLGGDIILSIQGITCNTPHNFSNIKSQIDDLKKGEPVVMTILRRGLILTLNSKH